MTAAAPRFSIIIPTHGRPRQLTRCLESLTRLEASRGGSEAIIVDDASPEPLHEILAPFADSLPVRLVVTPKGGPAKARNAGAAQARGEILAFTDDDCEPEPAWLRALDHCFRLHPDRLVGGRTRNALSDNVYSEASQQLLDFVYRWQESKSNGGLRFFASNNLAVSRLRFEALGGFASDFPFPAAEDRDFCARWIESGGELLYAPDARVMHSHEMGLFGFCRQHFTYGRGAWAFHASRAAGGAGSSTQEPWGFFEGLIWHAMRRSGGLARGVLFPPLMVVSQTAHAAGYSWEAIQVPYKRPEVRAGHR